MTSHQKPAASNQQPVTSSRQPTVNSQKQKAEERPFIVPIFLPHAGCPHRCVFCDQSSITGVPSIPSGKEIRNQIESFLKFKTSQRSYVQIAFFVGNFLGIDIDKIKRLLAEAAEFVKDSRADSIRFSTRPDTIDRRRLDIIQHFPVATIELGVQSMNDAVLTCANRGHTAADTIKAVQHLKAFDYDIGVQLMVGLPGDNLRQLLASARRIARLKPDFMRIYPTVVLAGSPLASRYKKGEYAPLVLEDAVAQTKKLFLLFQKENIPVIRMGLQATDDLQEGVTILAGPYHPAFGHLVYSEIFLDMAVEQLESTALNTDSISICVSPGDISKLRGLRNGNIEFLRKKFGFDFIAVRADDTLAAGQLKVSNNLNSSI